MSGRIVGYLWPSDGKPLPLSAGAEVMFGRDQACAVAIPDALVSRRHAKLDVLESGEVHLTDLGSRNGTFHNHRKLKEFIPQYLENGDCLRLGGQVWYFLREGRLPEVDGIFDMDTAVETLHGPEDINRVAVKAAAPALSGNNSQNDLTVVLQFLHANGKTGILETEAGNIHGEWAFNGVIAFERGAIYYAHSAEKLDENWSVVSKIGEDAVLACARQVTGHFFFHAGLEEESSPNVTVDTIKVIFDCCKTLDEEGRYGRRAPKVAPVGQRRKVRSTMVNLRALDEDELNDTNTTSTAATQPLLLPPKLEPRPDFDR